MARLRTEFPTVDVREVALWDHSGTSEFVHVLDDAGYSGLREQEYPREMRTERIQVQVERLDDCLPEGYQPDFIKIDVEGAERDVFAGAVATISRCRPHIVFEHGRAAGNYGARPEEIHDLLAGQAGLEIHDIDGNGPLSRQQMADIVAGGKVWNFVAGPSPRSCVRAVAPPLAGTALTPNSPGARLFNASQRLSGFSPHVYIPFTSPSDP